MSGKKKPSFSVKTGNGWSASVIDGGEIPEPEILGPDGRPASKMDAVRLEVEAYLADCYEQTATNSIRAVEPEFEDHPDVAANDTEVRVTRQIEAEEGGNEAPPPPEQVEPEIDRGPTALTRVGPNALMERPKHPLEELLDADTVDNVLKTVNRLGKWLSLFRAHWLTIVFFTVTGFALGAASYFASTPPTSIEFAMVLKSDATDNPVLGKSRSDVEFFRSVVQNFTGMALISDTLRKLGIDEPSEAQVRAVRDSLKLSSTGEGTYRGAYQTHNEDEGLTLMKAHVENYLDTEVDKTLSSIRAEAEFLQGQLAGTQAELRRTEAALIKFKKENQRGTPDAAQSSYSRLFELMRSESATRGEISNLELQLGLDRQKLAREDPMVESRRLAKRPYDARIVELEQRLALLRARGLGDKHPDVVALQGQIAELSSLAQRTVSNDAEVEQTRNTSYELIADRIHATEVKLELAKKRLSGLASEKTQVEEVVSSLPELEAEYTELTRSYQVTQGLHDRILTQLKNTELRLELERASASARFNIISPPQAVTPGRLMTIAVRGGIVGGFFLLLAVLVALATEFHRYNRVRVRNSDEELA